MESALQSSGQASSQTAAAEDQISQLNKLNESLNTDLQAAIVAKDQATQQSRTVQERAAELAAELESKDCRLRSEILHSMQMNLDCA